MLTKRQQIIQIFISSIHLLVWGMLYCFPIYFPDLKGAFNYSQEQINLIGAFIYIGASVIGVGFSPITIRLCKHAGGIAFGVIISVFSYLMIYLYYNDIIFSPFWAMIIYTALLGCSCNLSFIIFIELLMINTDSINLKTICPTFYSAIFALGGTAATTIYILFLEKKVEGFLLFTIWAHTVVGLISLLILLFNNYYKTKSNVQLALINQSNDSQDLKVTDENLISKEAGLTNELGFCQILKELMKDYFFWIIFSISILGSGIGSSYSTNLGNMTISFIGKDFLPTSSILFSISQTTGRLLVTIFSSPKCKINLSDMLIVISISNHKLT